MDSGLLIAFVPLMFVGGLTASFALSLLMSSWRWWRNALVGALLPPSCLLLADIIGSDSVYALNAETAWVAALIWAAALMPALIGALCGVFFGARARRRQEF